MSRQACLGHRNLQLQNALRGRANHPLDNERFSANAREERRRLEPSTDSLSRLGSNTL